MGWQWCLTRGLNFKVLKLFEWSVPIKTNTARAGWWLCSTFYVLCWVKIQHFPPKTVAAELWIVHIVATCCNLLWDEMVFRRPWLCVLLFHVIVGFNELPGGPGAPTSLSDQQVNRNTVKPQWGIQGLWDSELLSFSGGTLTCRPAFCLYSHTHLYCV